MLIHEMTEDECRAALQAASFGRLACARDDQPYVVPIYFSYDGEHLYGFSAPGELYAFSTLGQKIEWMRSNPLVCLEIDERTSHNRWMSVVVLGRYEELRDTEELGDQRVQAYRSLQQRAMWWEPACAAPERSERSLMPIFYRIHIRRMTGRRASPDPVEVAASRTEARTTEKSWLGSILSRWNRACPSARTSSESLCSPRQVALAAARRLSSSASTIARLFRGEVRANSIGGGAARRSPQ
jgi:nitroimidazol reductase NimA-like FMN-containing flavoprotein (pyridoxamine 5'-phosphate oxidase superfamily)